jgi:hypothetical protein
VTRGAVERKTIRPHFALSALAALTLADCASSRLQPSPVARNRCEWRFGSPESSTTGTQIVSRTTQAMFSVARIDNLARGYILLARGRPNWFVGQFVGGGGHVNGAGPRDHIWRVGALTYRVEYDASTNTANLLGHRIGLDTANVLFLDHVDQIGGDAELLGTACVPNFDLDDPDHTLLADPRTRAYVNTPP